MIIKNIEEARLLLGKTIVFNKNVEATEIDFDIGMKAVVTGTFEKNDLLHINLDFSKFEEYNRTLMQSTYYDGSNNPTVKWCDTTYYPKDFKTTEYCEFNNDEMCPFDVEEVSPLFRYSTQELIDELKFRNVISFDEAGYTIQYSEEGK